MGSDANAITSFLFPVAIVAVFYFLILRPKIREQKATEKMQSELKKGDKVLTQAGMIGIVDFIKDDVITVKVGNSQLDFIKSAITKVIKEKKD